MDVEPKYNKQNLISKVEGEILIPSENDNEGKIYVRLTHKDGSSEDGYIDSKHLYDVGLDTPGSRFRMISYKEKGEVTKTVFEVISKVELELGGDFEKSLNSLRKELDELERKFYMPVSCPPVSKEESDRLIKKYAQMRYDEEERRRRGSPGQDDLATFVFD